VVSALGSPGAKVESALRAQALRGEAHGKSLVLLDQVSTGTDPTVWVLGSPGGKLHFVRRRCGARRTASPWCCWTRWAPERNRWRAQLSASRCCGRWRPAAQAAPH